MLDFAAWTRRVSAFLRRLTRLPGAIVISDGIEAPATREHEREWLDSAQWGIPAEIRQFLLTASKRCVFSYTWTPPSSYRSATSKILPDRAVLNGGGDLCEAAKYSNYTNRDWFRKNLDPLYASFGLPEQYGDLRRIAGAMAEEQSQGRVPIMEMQNGGPAISLDWLAPDESWAVVYVERAGLPARRILSPSFEQFLLDWEKIGYSCLDRASLATWLDPITGQLNPDPAKCKALNRLLSGGESPYV